MLRTEAITLINSSLIDAQKSFPPFNTCQEGFSILHEEFDELWNEIKKSKHGDNEANIRTEAAHLAAMALRFLIDCT